MSSIALVLIVNLFQRSIGFGRAVLFCRWLEPEQLGYWEMASGFLLLAAPLAVLGLPGSFGRYLERYRQQGRVWQFLRRTTVWTFGLASASLAIMYLQRERLSTLVFGEPGHVELTIGMLVAIALVIYHHYVQAVFSGLRLFRVVSALHLLQSLLFAAISLSLLHSWRDSAESVLIGYAAACFLSTTLVLLWVAVRTSLPLDTGDRVQASTFWGPLLRFAAWLWLTNLLTNVFSIVDRYMILHCGAFTTEVALEQVGNYHSSNIVPVLLISVANLLVGAMTPHLSHDWELGRRAAVSTRINTGLKLTTLAMLLGGLVVLAFGPALFHYVFEGRYDAGLAVLPWTLTACVWFSLLLVAQTYVWCAEKSHMATPPLVAGLLINVGLNLLLLPVWGLLGAVVATALATLVALLGQFIVNHRLGMAVQPSSVALMFSPFLLVFNIKASACGMLILLLLIVTRGWVFTTEERAEIKEAIASRAPWLVKAMNRSDTHAV